MPTPAVPRLLARLLGALAVTLALGAGPAQAVTVSVDPGAYAGRWGVDGVHHVGPAVVDLPAGGRYVTIGGYGNFPIDVKADGTVEVIRSESALGGPGTLTFVTAPVTFDPGAYLGNWSIEYATLAWQRGVRTIDLVKGVGYCLWAGGYGRMGLFNLSDDGTVVQVDHGAFTVEGNLVRFVTAVVHFEPAGYTGLFGLDNALSRLTGSVDVVLVAGANYYLHVGGYGAAGWFTVRADGTLEPQERDAYSAAGQVVTFKTAPIRFATAGYAGRHGLDNATPFVSGDTTIQLVKGVGYYLRIGGYGAAGIFTIGADGQLVPAEKPSFGAAGDTVTFRTAHVVVDPGTFSGSYGFDNALNPLQGRQVLPLVLGVTYRAFDMKGAGFVALANPCAVTPASLALGPDTFTFACAERPSAIAGVGPIVAEGAPAALDGRGSTGTDLSFAWTQLSGTPVALSGAATATPTFTAPILAGGLGSEVLTFALTVSNVTGASTATVDVTVTNLDRAPVAEADGPAQVAEGGLVTLGGAGSYDPDGDPFTLRWVQVAGPAVELAGADAAQASFEAPMLSGGLGGPVLLQFQLEASDGLLATTDVVSVLVEQVDHPPVADAGAPMAVQAGGAGALDGSASADPDGDLLGFAWTQVGGPAVAFSGADSARPTFVAPAGAAELVFQLVVNDGLLESAPATVVVKVVDPNLPPDCSRAVASPAVLWPPNHKLVRVAVAGVTDPNDRAVSVAITGVSQNEPTRGLDRDDSGPDAILQGATVLLRAEKNGHGRGRVYLVGFTATDAAGASCAGQVKVTVPRSSRRGDDAHDDGDDRHDSRD